MERNYLRWHVARTPGPAILALEKKKKKKSGVWVDQTSQQDPGLAAQPGSLPPASPGLQ